MPSPGKTRLDALEARLTGPKRIALFGHRNVGKTTLLAMFYRQAASGQVPGVRLAAADAQCAEYLAEKIAQVESGQPMSGTLAETELNLRLYHGPARFELIVRDYQGEHVALGSTEPIQEFFAGCDAVFFCLDPEGSTDRPVALLLTKFDRVLSGLRKRSGDANDDSTKADQGSELEPRPSLAGPFVERLVDQKYGMTWHALRQHAPDGAIFAVSSFGPGSTGNRPPATLHPMGLEGPLGWLAEQLEARDRTQMEWLWELAPTDFPRLQRCVTDYERRYPRSNRSYEFRTRLNTLGRRRKWRRAGKLVLVASLLLALLAGYDFWGFHRATAFEREPENPAPLVARTWSGLLAEHPSLPLFWPSLARQARLKRNEWAVKAAGVQLASGVAV